MLHHTIINRDLTQLAGADTSSAARTTRQFDVNTQRVLGACIQYRHETEADPSCIAARRKQSIPEHLGVVYVVVLA